MREGIRFIERNVYLFRGSDHFFLTSGILALFLWFASFRCNLSTVCGQKLQQLWEKPSSKRLRRSWRGLGTLWRCVMRSRLLPNRIPSKRGSWVDYFRSRNRSFRSGYRFIFVAVWLLQRSKLVRRRASRNVRSCPTCNYLCNSVWMGDG